MALYSYQALAKDGKKISGQLDASSISEARDAIFKLGLYPVKISAAVQASAKADWRLWFKRSIGVKEKIFFTKQLALLLKSGVPLLQALELLVDQSEGSLKTIVISLKDDIKEGRSLADALSAFPKVFDSTYVQLVRAGEASGRLDVILNRLTSYLERRQEIARRVRRALSMPLFQLGFILLITSFLLIFIVPRIASTFATQGAELPLPTRILMSLSDFLRSYYYLVILVIIALVIAYRWWKSTPSGARAIDALKLRLPLVGYFARMGTVVQFSRTLGMLIEGGVNLAEALFIVSKIVDNKILADTLNEARDKIIKQGRIAEYLKKTGIFPPVAIYLINTGEQSGQLDSMLLTVAQNYEAELSELSDNLASKLEPVMTLVMAVIVGFIVISIVLPIIDISRIGGL